MSLLDSIRNLSSKLKPGFIFMIPVFFGCETSEDIGIPYELASDASVRFREFTLPASNTFVDSLRTDSENRILVGNYSDDLIGDVGAEGYFSIRYFNDNLPTGVIEDDYVLDSVRISFAIGSSSPGNGRQSIEVRLLEDTVRNFVYLSSKSEDPGEPLGSLQWQVTEDITAVNLPLDNAFGAQLFANVANRSVFSNQLIDWPSFSISPTDASEVISEVSLPSDTSRLYLYVSDPDGIEEITETDTIIRDTTYLVEFDFNAPHYVNLQRDRSNGLFAGIAENQLFDLADGRTIIDPTAGITTVVSIEALADFFEDSEDIIINSASLLFEYEGESERDTLESFYSFIYSNNDFPGAGRLVNPFSSLIMSDNAYLSGANNPAVSSLGTDNAQLILNATLFFQNVYQTYRGEGEGLAITGATVEEIVPFTELIFIGNRDVTLQRTIFPPNGIKLVIYYTEVDR